MAGSRAAPYIRGMTPELEKKLARFIAALERYAQDGHDSDLTIASSAREDPEVEQWLDDNPGT